MKRTFAAIAIATAFFGAHAQTAINGQTSTTAADSTALNAGNNQSSTYYSAAPSPLTVGALDQRVHTNQAYSTPPAFSSPAVMGTCATAGRGFSAQLPGGGAAYSGPGGVDAGCDLERDLRILKDLGAGLEVAKQRACAKAEIAQAMADAGTPCKTAAQKAAGAAMLDGAPVAAKRQPMPWQAGG